MYKVVAVFLLIDYIVFKMRMVKCSYHDDKQNQKSFVDEMNPSI